MRYRIEVIDTETGKVVKERETTGQLDSMLWLERNRSTLLEAERKHPGRFVVKWTEQGKEKA